MTDSAPISASSSDLRAVVVSTGSASAPEPAFTPEELVHVDQVLAMDPLRDVPGPVTGGEGMRFSAPTVDALPPDLRQEVYRQLDNLKPEFRQEREAQIIDSVVRHRIIQNRVLTGLGEGALPFHREEVAIAREVRDTKRLRDNLQAQLDEVIDHETVFDEATGTTKAQPVMLVQGERRRAYEAQIADYDRRVRLLHDGNSLGIEGQKRMRDAMRETVALRMHVAQEAADLAEVKALADEMLRKERIEARAKALANMRRNEVR